MTVEVINKRKTEPELCHKHKTLVPLRITGYTSGFDSKNPEVKKAIEDECGIGDICFTMGGYNTPYNVFNCRTGKLIYSDYAKLLLLVRAYDVQFVILMNDNEPAPVL